MASVDEDENPGTIRIPRPRTIRVRHGDGERSQVAIGVAIEAVLVMVGRARRNELVIPRVIDARLGTLPVTHSPVSRLQ